MPIIRSPAARAAYGAFSSHRRDAKTRTRENLLDAACDAILAGGEQSATVDRMVQDAGISRATFYLHFQSRDELFSALRSRMTSQLDEHYDRLALLGSASKETLKGWVLGMFGMCRQDRKLVLSLIRSGTASSASFDTRKYYSSVIERIGRGVARFREASTDMKTKTKALLLLMQIESIIRYLVTHDLEAEVDAFADDIAEQLYRFMRYEG